MLFAHDCALEPWHVAKCTSCDPKQHARNIKTTLTFHKPAEDLTSEPSKTKISLTVTSHNIPSFRNDGCMMLPSIEPKRHHPLANLQAPCRRPVATHLTVNRTPPKIAKPPAHVVPCGAFPSLLVSNSCRIDL